MIKTENVESADCSGNGTHSSKSQCKIQSKSTPLIAPNTKPRPSTEQNHPPPPHHQIHSANNNIPTAFQYPIAPAATNPFLVNSENCGLVHCQPVINSDGTPMVHCSSVGPNPHMYQHWASQHIRPDMYNAGKMVRPLFINPAATIRMPLSQHHNQSNQHAMQQMPMPMASMPMPMAGVPMQHYPYHQPQYIYRHPPPGYVMHPAQYQMPMQGPTISNNEHSLSAQLERELSYTNNSRGGESPPRADDTLQKACVLSNIQQISPCADYINTAAVPSHLRSPDSGIGGHHDEGQASSIPSDVSISHRLHNIYISSN